MYNRYIPQADGSFLHSVIPDAEAAELPSLPDEPSDSCPAITPPITKTGANPGKPNKNSRQYHHAAVPNSPRRNPQYTPSAGSIGSFLHQLLPQGFDTEDLLVVVLLLLMSGDNREDQNWALLTLIIYLFL